MSIVRRVLHFALFFVSFVFFVLAASSLYLVKNGYMVEYIPCCNSMFPYLNNGNLSEQAYPCLALFEVLNTVKSAGNVTVGDVVTYRYKYYSPIVHRINASCAYLRSGKEVYYLNDYASNVREYFDVEEGYVLKGDNNVAVDGCIPSWAITGKLVAKFCVADILEKKAF